MIAKLGDTFGALRAVRILVVTAAKAWPEGTSQRKALQLLIISIESTLRCFNMDIEKEVA